MARRRRPIVSRADQRQDFAGAVVQHYHRPIVHALVAELVELMAQGSLDAMVELQVERGRHSPFRERFSGFVKALEQEINEVVDFLYTR